MTLAEFLQKDFFQLTGLSRLLEDERAKMEESMAKTVQVRAFSRILELITHPEDKAALVDAVETDTMLADQILARFQINPDHVALEEAILHKIELYEGITGDLVTP